MSSKLQRSQKDLSSQIQSISSDLSNQKDLSSKLQSAVSDIEDHKKQIQSISSDLSNQKDLSSKLQSAVSDIEDHKKQLSIISSDLSNQKDLSSKLQSAVSDIEDHKKQLSVISSDLSNQKDLSSKLQSAVSDIEDHKKQLSVISSDLSNQKDLSSKLQSAVSDIEDHKKQLSVISSDLSNQKDLSSKLQSAVSDIEDHKKQIQSISSDLSNQKDLSYKLQSAVSDIEDHKKQIQSISSDLSNQLQSYSGLYSECETKFVEFTDDIAKINERDETKQTQMIEIKKEISDTNIKFDEWFNKLGNVVAETRKDLNEAKQGVSEFKMNEDKFADRIVARVNNSSLVDIVSGIVESILPAKLDLSSRILNQDEHDKLVNFKTQTTTDQNDDVSSIQKTFSVNVPAGRDKVRTLKISFSNGSGRITLKFFAVSGRYTNDLLFVVNLDKDKKENNSCEYIGGFMSPTTFGYIIEDGVCYILLQPSTDRDEHVTIISTAIAESSILEQLVMTV